MANYNLTNQTISSSFQQLLQKNETTGYLVDGVGSVVDGLQISGSTSGSFVGDGSGLTGVVATVPAGTVSGSSQIILTDTSGNLGGNRITGSVPNATSASHAEVADLATLATSAIGATNTDVQVKNLEATEIAKGTPLYFTDSGTSGNIVGAYRADASNPSRMPAAGIAGETIAAGAEGQAFLDGYIGGVDTSLFGAGDSIYVAPGGGYINSRPTGSNILVQGIGYVAKSAVNGSGVIQGSGRANDVPNIQQGYAWVGNVDGVAVAISTASWDSHSDLTSLNAFTQSQENLNATFATTGSNDFVGAQTVYMSNFGDSFQITGSNFYFKNQFSGDITQLNGGAVIFGGTNGPGTDLTKLGLQTRNPNTSDNAIIYTSKPYLITDYNKPTGSLLNQTGIFFNRDTDFGYSYPTNGILTLKSGSQYDGILHVGDGLNTNIDGNLTIDGTTQFNNNLTVDADLTVNGTTALNGSSTQTGYLHQQTISALGSNQAVDSIVITNLTGSNTIQYPFAHVGIQNYPGTNEQAFSVEYSNSAYTYYNALFVNPTSTKLELNTGVGYDYDNVELKDNGDNTSTFAVKADNLELGKLTATSIEIGNASSTNVISGSNSFEGVTGFNSAVVLNNTFMSITSSVNDSQTRLSPTEIYTKDGSSVVQAQMGTSYGGNVGLYNISTADQFGLTLQSENWGFPANWDGPGIFANNPSNQYPTIIGFQKKSNWTDGRATFLAPLVVSGSVSITDTMNLTPQDPLPSGTVGDLAVSGSNLYFYNGAWTQVV